MSLYVLVSDRLYLVCCSMLFGGRERRERERNMEDCGGRGRNEKRRSRKKENSC